MKDSIYASTLNQVAKVTKIVTSHDNIYNRPESVPTVIEYPCRVARKGNSYGYASQGNINIQPQMRCYLEIDVDIKSGMAIEVDNVKYIAGLVYKPNNHHTEIDINTSMEA